MSFLDTITVKQDTFGRYCLNDLHKASGEAKKDQPADFVRLASSQELAEGSIPGIPGLLPS